MLLVGSNVPNAAQGLVKICPSLYVMHCDGRGGTVSVYVGHWDMHGTLDAGVSV
jgi:hypothetical protein